MLFLVGIGLGCKDLSLGAIEACKRSELYVDRYTSVVSGEQMAQILQLSGKQAKVLGRKDMEEDLKVLVTRAKSMDVAILIGGDPLMATTHKIILIEAKRQGVHSEIVHSSSILSAAIGESGLDFYRFGCIATIPKWSEHYKPVSFYESVRKNLSNNLHSLLMLDYKQELGASLTPKEAIGMLKKAEESYKLGIICDSTIIMILNNVSSSKQNSIFTTISKAENLELEGPSVIIIPAAITEIEMECVGSMCRVL